MEAIIHVIHQIVVYLATFGGLILELCGISILVFKGVQAFLYWLDKKEETSVNLGEGIAMSLEFLMAAEVLNTVKADEYADLIMLGALVVLRGIMTFEIHMELKNERAELANENMKAVSEAFQNGELSIHDLSQFEDTEKEG